MERKLIKKSDIIIIAVIVILAVGALIIFGGGKGAYAEISVDGNEVMKVPLDKDDVFVMEELKYPPTITVKDGKIAVTESTCPTGVCESTGFIGREGEMIVCLPDKLIIEIVE